MDVGALELEPALPPTTKKKVTKEVKLDTTPRYIKEKPKPKKKEKEKKVDDVFGSLGLMTVDDLLGGAVSDDEESGASEVQTGGATSEIATIMDDSGRQTPLRSILSSPQPNARRSSGPRRRVSLKDDVRSRSPSPEIISTARGSRTSIDYDDEFEESIGTEQPSTIRTDHDDSGSEPDSYTYSRNRSRKHSYSRTRSEDYYSDDFTSGTETSRLARRYSRSSSVGSYSEDFTDYSETDYSRYVKHL